MTGDFSTTNPFNGVPGYLLVEIFFPALFASVFNLSLT